MNNNLKIYDLINHIKSNDFIKVKHNNNSKCISTNGVVRKIDKSNKLLYILDFKISFDDIIDIKKCCNLF